MNNFIQEGKYLNVACSSPATPASGDPVRFGYLTGVAVTAEGAGGNASTETTVKTDGGVYDLSVAAINDSGNSNVAVGDMIFYVDADTPHLSKKSSGYFFGFALEASAPGDGSAATINVLHVPGPGSGSVASGAITTTKIADANVTAAKLTTTLATGYIPLDFFNARIIGTNEIAAVVGAATDPVLSRNSTSTDKAGRLKWASASVIEVQFPTICYPPDLDDSAAITVNFLARMKAGSVDTPVLTVAAFEAEGDTDCGGNTAALSTTLAKVSVTLAAGNVGAYPKSLAISVKPGTHATASNDVYLYGAWIEYTRK